MQGNGRFTWFIGILFPLWVIVPILGFLGFRELFRCIELDRRDAEAQIPTVIPVGILVGRDGKPIS